MTEPVDEAAAARHRAKMEKRKAVQDAEVAGKTVEKGLLIVHTGSGKGKSTAAFGLALRVLDRGHRVGVVQFVKGAWHTAERDALKAFGDQVAWHTMGEGFTWETQDLARDIAAAERETVGGRRLRALYFTRASAPHGVGPRYHHIGLYAYRRAALERFVRLPPSPLELQERLEQLRALEAGMRIDVTIVDTVPRGVDTPADLETARRILAKS